MSAHDARLVPAAVLGLVSCLAIVSGAQWWLIAGPLAVACVGRALVAAWASRRLANSGSARIALMRQVVVGASVAAAIASLLGAGAAGQLQVRMSDLATAAAAEGARVTVDGVVAQEARPGIADRFTGEPTWEAIVNVVAVDGTACKAPIRVVAALPDGLELGGSVRLEGALNSSHQVRFAAVLWGAEVLGRVALRASARSWAMLATRLGEPRWACLWRCRASPGGW